MNRLTPCTPSLIPSSIGACVLDTGDTKGKYGDVECEVESFSDDIKDWLAKDDGDDEGE